MALLVGTPYGNRERNRRRRYESTNGALEVFDVVVFLVVLAAVKVRCGIDTAIALEAVGARPTTQRVVLVAALKLVVANSAVSGVTLTR